MSTSHLTEAINLVGLQPLARALGVTYQAVKKWEARGRLPRTEWTGETSYAAIIERQTGGLITKEMLVAVTPNVHPERRVSCNKGDI